VADILRPDLCVIGAGSGGLSAAAAAALFGVPVVLIEKDRMGGECLNVGCVPSKALIAAGERAHAMRGADDFGILAQEPKVAFAKVQAHVREVIAAIAPIDSQERFTALGVKVIRAEARFTDPRTVVAGETAIMARRFVIAAGSRPAIPPIPGLDSGAYLTNETIFDLTTRPRRLIVIGAGPVGLELAQAHRRLGSEVVVLESGIALAREDREIANEVLAALGREGVAVREGVSIGRVETTVDGVRVTLAPRDGEAEEVVQGSHVLVATGRRPVVDGLGLEAAGIATDARGIMVDASLRTTNRRVFAIGDCAGGPFTGYRFTHAANYHAGLVIRSALFRLPARLDNNLIPRVTFTDPEIASVGLLEEEARRGHKSIRVLRWPFAENDRAQAGHATCGHIKVVTTTKGRILGCSIAGAHAGELIVPWIMALARKGSVRDFAGLVFPYPTLSEVSRRAALSFLAPSAANPWVRWLIGFLRRFG
jgi:pyruvate/2-oxoglutarate dehydrogenase complex dihydrolipoamide dehydrogenase (E3) component